MKIFNPQQNIKYILVQYNTTHSVFRTELELQLKL